MTARLPGVALLGAWREWEAVADRGGWKKMLPMDDWALAQLFIGRRSLCLLVLNACDSSQAQEGGLFSGVGPALVQKRIPAVIAMQYPAVSIKTAGQFSRAFYQALMHGLPVDVAVNQGRQLLSAGPLLADRDWSTPVLYMGTRSGHILDFLHQEADAVGHAWDTVRSAVQHTDRAAEALAALTQRFSELVNRHRQVEILVKLSHHVRDLQTDFAPCVQIIEHPKWTVENQHFIEFKQGWQRVRLNRLEPLRVFVQRHPDLSIGAWLGQLMQEADDIDAGVERIALVPLTKQIRAFHRNLAQVEADIHQQFESTIADLLAFSNHTLGRLVGNNVSVEAEGS